MGSGWLEGRYQAEFVFGAVLNGPEEFFDLLGGHRASLDPDSQRSRLRGVRQWGRGQRGCKLQCTDSDLAMRICDQTGTCLSNPKPTLLG